MKTFILLLLTVVLTATATWFIHSRIGNSETAVSADEPLYYQSAMHPWIKSDKPGRCTICGMELTPVYPGEKGFDDAGGEDVISLSETQMRTVGVATEKVAVRDLSRTLQVAGTMDDNALSHRIVSAYVDARVDRLFDIFVGTEVTAGEPLMEIYSPVLLQAEREYRTLTGPLKATAALRLRQMGITEEQIQDVEGKPAEALTSTVVSPMSGTVVSRNVYEGQYVKEGEQLLEIADFSTMWFLFDAYEQDLSLIRTGQAVEVSLPSRPGKTYAGSITFIDPNFNETTRTTEVRVELPNPHRELSHKVYAEGSVLIEMPDVLAVPRSAIIQTGTQAYAYVDEGDGIYRQVPVTIGRRGDRYLEVLSGLKEGQQVVTQGTLLIDGQAEMNRSYVAVPVEDSSSPEPTAEQQATIRSFLETVDAMSAALAADDLNAFNTAAAPAMEKTGQLIAALKPLNAPADALAELDKHRHFHGMESLAKARAAFLPFSMAASAALAPLGLPEVRIFECPMVDEAIAGAEKKGRWLQTGERALANPYFGAEMLTCGKQIQP